MASAVETLINGNTSDQPVSFYDYYNAYGQDKYGKNWNIADPYSFGGKFENWLHGTSTSAKQQYDNYLADFEFKKNQAASAAAEQAKREREDSEVQRRMEDYQKAGLNPYLLLNSGSMASAPSSSVEYAKYKRSSKDAEVKNESKLVSSALKVLALMLLKSI